MDIGRAIEAIGAGVFEGACRLGRMANSHARELEGLIRVETADMQALSDTTPFKFETELRDPCVEWIDSQFDETVIVDECDVVQLAPDLVIGIGSDFTSREAQDFPAITNWTQLALTHSTWHEPGHQITRPELGGAVRAVRPLLLNGVMSELADGGLRVEELPERPFEELVAIELKLTDWKKAMRQAARYQVFAERSYVAMPESAIKQETVIAACDAGVGILSINQVGCECLVEAQYSKIVDPRMAAMASELVFSAATGQKQFLRAAGSRRGTSNPVPALAL